MIRVSAFASSDAPVKPMTEKQFAQSFTEMAGNVKGFIRYTSIAVVVALLCVAANTMAMSLRERTREIALLKAIGFSQNTVLGMFLSESVVIGLLGGVVGALGGKLLGARCHSASVACPRPPPREPYAPCPVFPQPPSVAPQSPKRACRLVGT